MEEYTKYQRVVQGLEVTRPDQVRPSDMTYVRLREELAYLAVALDVFTRNVRGWPRTTGTTGTRAARWTPAWRQ